MATFSRSPLCPHVEQGNAGANDPDGWLRTQPVLPTGIKFMNLDACREAKAVNSNIFTVYRRFVANQWAYIERGAEGGRAWVRDWRHVEGVDCGESPNEAIGFDDEAGWRLYNTFLLGFVEECVRRNVTPVIANIAVGNPREDLVALTRDAVQACGEVGGYVGYHGYGPAIIRDLEGERHGTAQYHGYTQDQVTAADLYLVSRGPLLLTPLWRQAGVTAAIRYLYTECLHDGCNTPIENGGMGALIGRRLPDGFIIDWPHIIRNHELYARRMVEIGIEKAFMFTFWGTAEWWAYEYTTRPQMMEWYSRHLAEFVPEPPPPPPPPIRNARWVRRDATPYINIRHAPPGPDFDTGVDVGNLYPGCLVQLLETRGDWARVYVDALASSIRVEVEGWVRVEYLTATPGG
jgi:hypothetical protein